jgi:arylsulfatase
MAPQAPRGAPNILIVMTDDVGFGASSTFGGPIPTATADALAAHGLRYNRFHTTAMCSPTRAALLTGRNHHAVGNGAITNVATPDPGYNSVIPASAATIGNILRANGYATAWFGKNHNTPEWEITPAGPFDRWPSGYGFDYFYGFMGGATNQWAPALIEDHRAVAPPPNDPGYILDQDLADRAISWLNVQTSLRPDTPFLVYMAPGSPHSPHQAPRQWIERFHGRFDRGWDRLREETLARQIAMGIVPAGTRLTERPAEIPAWDTLPPEQRRVAARMMEVYAAQLSHFDYQLGRVVEELRRLGRLDNTLIIYVQGDNGASAEGGIAGLFSDMAGLNNSRPSGRPAPRDEDFGSLRSYENYPAGWAWAMGTPFPWMKQVASHLGGTRNGLIVSWPARIAAHGEVRSQFHHVIDIAPTLYEAAGIRPPGTFQGVRQRPIDGVSMVYSFADPRASSRHREQYFELLGNRAYYRDGWLASTTPGRLPWRLTQSGVRAEDFAWELYDLDHDFSQSRNLAAQEPARLAALRRAFDEAARRNHIYPLDADFGRRVARELRPYLFNGRNLARFANTETRYFDQSFPDIKNRSWTVEADVVAGSNDSGTIVTQGGWVGGWGLFVFNGRPTFLYKQADGVSDAFRLGAARALTPGRHTIRLEFSYDGGQRGAGGELVMSVDGAEVARGRIDRTVPSLFVGEGASIGRDYGTALSTDYRLPFTFNGTINEVRISFPDQQAAR